MPVSVASPASVVRPPETVPKASTEDTRDVVKAAYALWTAGRKDEAVSKMREAVAALEKPVPDGTGRRRELGTGATIGLVASDDGAWVVTGGAQGALILDGPSSDVRALLDVDAERSVCDSCGGQLRRAWSRRARHDRARTPTPTAMTTSCAGPAEAGSS